MISKSKKLIIFLIIFLVVYSSLPFRETKKAEALTVYCVNCSRWAADIVHFAETVARWIKEDLMKALRDTVAKRIIDYIVDETVKWIQGGGKPQFVSDWQGFLRQAGNIAFDQVIKEVGLSALCSPFKLQIQLSLLPVQRFSQRIDCTLDDVIKNIEGFYQDFENGGWIAYNEAWQPQNNYYGQMLMIHDELVARMAQETEAARNEALAGGGFLSVKRCVASHEEVDLGTGQISKVCDKEEITTPGSTVGEAVASAITSDKDWAANIQSWTSALVNAVINRLIKEGLSLMLSSGEGHDSYYPSGYQQLVDEETKKQKQSQIDQIQRLVNEWQYLLDVKTKSLSYAEQLKEVLTEIKNRNCPSSSFSDNLYLTDITDINSRIQTIQRDIERLKTEIDDLKKKIDEGNDVIEKIKNATTTAEMTVIENDVLAFIDKYYSNTTEIEEIITGSARQAADQEMQNKQSYLLKAQEILNSCIQMQTFTPTPSTQR